MLTVEQFRKFVGEYLIEREKEIKYINSLPTLHDYLKQDLSYILPDRSYGFETSDFGEMWLLGAAILELKEDMLKRSKKHVKKKKK